MNEEDDHTINKRLQIINHPYIFSYGSPNKRDNPSQYSQLIEDSPNSSEEHSEKSEDVEIPQCRI